jgi:hypothetical protein
VLKDLQSLNPEGSHRNVIPERFAFPGRSATFSKFNALVKLEAIPNNAKLININSTKNYGD